MEVNFFNSDEFKSQLLNTGRSPITRLKGLCRILSVWNEKRITGSKDLNKDISINDINILRDIVQIEVNRLKQKNAEVVTDQILFMLIGALKLQAQHGSQKPWELVNQSINNFTKEEKSLSQMLISLIFITIVVVIGMTANSNVLRKNTDTTVSNMAPINDAGSTVTSLVSVYNKMKEGNCQLPQAAMLQPQEREAFISFVNEGIVEVETADNLKNALAYVNCLYPQKLMDKPL